jgi:nicotinamidase-related amidase
MSATQRLGRDDTAILVVDLQERLAAAMDPSALASLMKRVAALVEGARALGLPLVVTEQYPKGLGPTVGALREKLGEVKPVEKLRFSALGDSVRVQLAGRRNVVVAGMETHVCVFQTVRDLVDAGLRPILCVDAVLSRFPADREAGLQLARDAGATLSSVEAVLFDLLGEAGTPEFKRISAAVR